MSATSAKIVQVLLPLPFDKAFTYEVPEGMVLERGAYVEVPFRQTKIVGVAWDVSPIEVPTYDLKSVIRRIDLPSLPAVVMDFVAWVAAYYLSPKGLVLKMVLSAPTAFKDMKRPRKTSLETHSVTIKEASLTASQTSCAQMIREAIQTEKFNPILLEGVTGSGKTEVYFKGILEAKAHGKQSLILLPEIALSTQWLDRFMSRFSEPPLVWHSDLTEAKRRETWRTIAKGDASVIVGARSALFLPYPNLGFVVVDEEHDGGYKQDTGVFYQARDMALVRAKLSNATVVLSSATPSLETLKNVTDGKYKKCTLEARHGGASMPQVHTIDLRKRDRKKGEGPQWISKVLRESIQATLAKGEQSLLFLNRRGYAPLMICDACGHRISCKQCESWMVYHKSDHALRCHHCGQRDRFPSQCAECHEEQSFVACGPGVERVAEEAYLAFPDARIEVVTSDTMTSVAQMTGLMQRLENREVDIIVGTQVMAKGHHFPYLTLVGIVDGDLGLSGGDLRATERTYQLLHQVSGRAGRAQNPGHVYIQTHLPEHAVMQALINQDQENFLKLELENRAKYELPPFGRLASFILSSDQETKAEHAAWSLAKMIPQTAGITVLGPSPASRSKLKGKYRWRFLIKSSRNIKLQAFLQGWTKKFPLPTGVRLQIDLDPYNFL
jgi:primosomal protein N' (replication factor Y)